MDTIFVPYSQDSVIFGKESIPRSECPYEAADTCTGFQPKTCCERVNGDNTTTPGSNETDVTVTSPTIEDKPGDNKPNDGDGSDKPCDNDDGDNEDSNDEDFNNNGMNTMYSSFLIALCLLVFHLKLQ